MVQMVLPRVKWLPMSMAVSIALSAGLPYLVAVAMKQVPAFIPFIRHSAAYPPQSGIFSIFLATGTFLGMLTLLLRCVAVQHREFLVEHSRNRKLNLASLVIGLLLNIFLIYTSNNPLGFKRATKTQWIVDVLVPHHIGALCVCLFTNAYVLIQAYMTYQQKRIFEKNVFLHAVLAVCVIVSTWTAIIPLSSSLKDEIKTLSEDENHLIGLEYAQYSFYSTICALSEWAFTFFSLLFIFSFYKDFEKMTVRLQLKPKRVISSTVELPTLRDHDDREATKI